ncbi:MAG TPA: elongation subunit of DNA-dependent DNA polymerase [Lachnospiraceae bacterium]|jgi:uncharacterized protein YprB with RNaseH-like and TPR domain|nr:elongation subunit of DNA-dependent DNA polymerase [Lachnospiraceae bacterium]
MVEYFHDKQEERKTMQTWHKELNFDNTNSLTNALFAEDSVFFDIETTGFSPVNTSLYLIGCARRKGNLICIDQFFADTPDEERLILSAFLELLKPYRTLITFNGLGFDIPYLTAKCQTYGMPAPFLEFSNLDIFRALSKFKKIFKLPNLKQKTVEKFLGIGREDLYSGGDLINVYHQYVATQEEEARYLLQIHNYEDVLGMIDLLPILSYPQIFQGAFTVDSIVKNLYEDYQSITKNECIITLKNQYPVPKRISYGFDQFYLTSYQDTTKLSIKIYSGELKYFYPNYKDYYYLPEEDTAIHKSVAFYVDKNYRTKAKAATCYSKKTGCFLPQHQVVVSPYFKLEYHDKITYFELTDEFIDNETDVKAYVMHVLSLLLMAK